MDNEEVVRLVTGMKDSMEREIQASESRIKEDLTEQIRDSETRLLTEFHKWASPVEAR
jgi:flagellar capping protein FliD